jgi:sugar (pentulose or hexulose) kinase
LSYLGVDIGTSVAKLVLFSGAGELIASASRPIPLHHPLPGRVEQDPELIATAVRELRAEVVADREPPELIAITGQGDGCWLLDAAGNPTRPGISWLDARGADVLSRWTADGVADQIYRISGNAVFPGAQAPILRWLDENSPNELDRAATAGYCKDFVFQNLTGIRATDASDASLPFGDGFGGYSAAALDLTGLRHRADLLAPVDSPLPMGESGDGTPVVSGPFDMPACTIGAGVAKVGDGLLTLGTTLASQVLVDRIDCAGEPAGMHLALNSKDRWVRVMAAMVGTASLDWTLSLLGLGHDQLDGVLADSPPGAHGITALPYFAPSGERAPFVDAAARGTFDGIRLTTTPADLVRALCEGLAFAARQCLQAAGLTGRLLVCGGGTRSLPWLRLIASVLGRPIELARTPEVGARGAVLAALQAIGRPVDMDRWTAPESVIDPDPSTVDFYTGAYADYLVRQQSARARWQRT